jgi:hypothetical protein
VSLNLGKNNRNEIKTCSCGVAFLVAAGEKLPECRHGNTLKNLVGRKFGRLQGLADSGLRNSSGCVMWLTKCRCGKLKPVASANLLFGLSRSCGCAAREHNSLYPKHLIHGASVPGSPLYSTWCIWVGLRARCTNPNHRAWKWYGGKGVTVDSRWLGKLGFQNFLADMGKRPAGLSLDRKEPSVGYSKDNCCWATAEVQANNQSRYADRLEVVTAAMAESASDLRGAAKAIRPTIEAMHGVADDVSILRHFNVGPRDENKHRIG